MEENKKSTYFFIGKLSDHSAKYYVSNLEIFDNLVFEVMLDNVSMWGHTNEDFNSFFPKIKEILNILVSAFVFKSKKALSFTIENWVESKGVVCKENMIGWVLNTHGVIKHFPRHSKNNTGWKKAVYLYKNIKKINNNHIIALKDYRASLTDTGDDAFFFAYRAIEDIRRAVTGIDDTNDKSWINMHQKLGTSKAFIDPLVKVAVKVRHGNKNDPLVLSARDNKKQLIEISRQVIEKEFKRVLPKF